MYVIVTHVRYMLTTHVRGSHWSSEGYGLYTYETYTY